MHNFIYQVLVLWLIVIFKRALPLPIDLQEKQQEERLPGKLIIPESNAVEQPSDDSPVFIMVPVVGDRSRREIKELMGLDNASFETPNIIRLNATGDEFEVMNLVPNRFQIQAPKSTNGNGGGPLASGCCPPPAPKPIPPPSWGPLCLTIVVDNAFPPGKANRIVITNSSEIKGSGALLKIGFTDTKTTQCANNEIVNFESNTPMERFESQKKKKIDDNEEEDETDSSTDGLDQKILQEIILKILTGNKTSQPQPNDEVFFIENSTNEPAFSFVLNPSLYSKISAKYDTVQTTKRPTTNNDVPNQPDFDSLLKTVEQMSTAMSKDKLLSLLSNLINKTTLNKEVSSNQ